jgi:D-amino-acid dehydrogenase
MTEAPKRILIVGGGVIGVCCAYFMSRRGAQVTLLERDEIGRGASYGNAGTIAPGHGPINKPGRILQALRWMFDPTAPLHVVPRLDPALARWLWTFRAHCNPRHVLDSLDVLGPMGHASRALIERLVVEEGLECDFSPDGYYEVYRTEAAFGAARREADVIRGYDYHPQILDGPSMRAREPALKPGTVGGVYFPEAATLNPHRFVLEMADRAKRHGADVRDGTPVERVVVDDGREASHRGDSRGSRVVGVSLPGGELLEADAVVLATGSYSPHLLRSLGVHLPIQAAKGYHRDRDPEKGGTPPLQVACVLGERFVFCTPMDGVVRYAGTLEFSGENHEIRPRRLNQLTESAKAYFDGVGDAHSESEWCGLRPCTPDGLPVLGPVPGYSGLFAANGHAMLGLTLGPITGQLMAEYVIDGTPSMKLEQLRVDRF